VGMGGKGGSEGTMSLHRNIHETKGKRTPKQMLVWVKTDARFSPRKCTFSILQWSDLSRVQMCAHARAHAHVLSRHQIGINAQQRAIHAWRGTPHSNVWHASFTRMICLIHTCGMPHSRV